MLACCPAPLRHVWCERTNGPQRVEVLDLAGLPAWGTASLIAVLASFGLAILLVIIEVVRDPDLSPKAKAGWVVGLVITNFFAITIYFAQGRTGRLARIASYLLMTGLFASMGLIAAALVR